MEYFPQLAEQFTAGQGAMTNSAMVVSDLHALNSIYHPSGLSVHQQATTECIRNTLLLYISVLIFKNLSTDWF